MTICTFKTPNKQLNRKFDIFGHLKRNGWSTKAKKIEITNKNTQMINKTKTLLLHKYKPTISNV
jgi:long-subunit fatty acid transport protein